MKIEECIRCRSKDVITCMVNTRITLNGEKTKAFGVESQKKYEPTDTIKLVGEHQVQEMVRKELNDRMGKEALQYSKIIFNDGGAK